uniref:Ribonuclease H-like domain-containing protein n=1 Tax=Tanacetum cinerariifolium TaxID=118510 RepID=A0A6L2LK99_TANCI|nr:ribonuclease H-like domain-containing protein [Tanacetum cinerariifolium]
MYDEYNALVSTWILIPMPSDVNLVCSMLLFKHKFHADVTLIPYKVRLVANGNSQQLGVDFDDTFSLVIKPATIHTNLSLVMSRKWPIHQLDVKNAFLNGDLSETVYMYQHARFVDSRYPHHWKYALQLLKHAHMVNYDPSRTPIDTVSKLVPEGVPVQDPTLYRSLARASVSHVYTSIFILCSTTNLSLYSQSMGATFVALKRILRYVHGTLDFGLHIYASTTTSQVGYTDADWAGFPSTRSTPSSAPVSKLNTEVRVLHVPSRYQDVDIFNKGLPSAFFKEFQFSLHVQPPLALTVGAYCRISNNILVEGKRGNFRERGWMKILERESKHERKMH